MSNIVAFDAKRAFCNNTGLGNYARSIILNLLKWSPEIKLQLYTPAIKDRQFHDQVKSYPNVNVLVPSAKYSLLSNFSKSLWRTYRLSSLFNRSPATVFHGTSNELPIGIHTGNIVTIHDLFYLHFAKDFTRIDREIYSRKVTYACKHASTIIAISNQTKRDLITAFPEYEDKVILLHQCCHERYYEEVQMEKLEQVKVKHNLPEKFFLYVGSFNKRKNASFLLSVMKELKQHLEVPLIMIGRKNNFQRQLEKEVKRKGLEQRVRFLNNVEDDDLAAIYSLGSLLLYPSYLEGFGLPLVEAQACGLPVLVSDRHCFQDAAGNHSLYATYNDTDQWVKSIQDFMNSKDLSEKMSIEGRKYVTSFHPQITNKHLTDLYYNKFLK